MIKNRTYKVFQEAFLSVLVLGVLFTIVEPAVSFGASASSTFTVSQQVNAEISFSTTPSNVTMTPALGGITGGEADGSTQFVVATNDLLGYTMTIQGSSSSGAMIGQASSTNSIPGYGPVGTPDFTFSAPANAARFGYSVGASSTSDVAPYFRNNNSSTCDTGNYANTTGTTTAGLHCWWAATSTATTIISRNLPAPAPGATSTLYFRVIINSNPSPTIPNDTYIATSTVTAVAN